MSEYEFWAPCQRGLEGVCADELKTMGITRVRPLQSGVMFFGPLRDGYRACLWSSVASRILLILARVAASDADELYACVHEISWEDHVSEKGSLAVDANGTNDALRNTQFTAVKTKDAICDRLRELTGIRPDVEVRDPDVRVNVTVHSTKATIAIDLSGAALHRRGYRSQGRQVEAPLKESLAAGILLLADWPAMARRGCSFCDPMCGSGTLAIEAALRAGDVAPGILRDRWGFDRWLGGAPGIWDGLLEEADERAQRGRTSIPPCFASDRDEAALELARAGARRAQVADVIDFSCHDFAQLEAPDVPAGLIATNPPYGRRLETLAQLPALYALLAARLREGFVGWKLAAITSDEGIDAGLGMEPDQVIPLFNGRIESALHIYTVGGPQTAQAPDGGKTAEQIGAPSVMVGQHEIYLAERNSEQFISRLKRNVRLVGKWARREGVSCYRVYDADLPDYAVAIDVYHGAGPDEGRTWVRVSEYAPPKEIDPARARRRLADVLASVPAVLDVDTDDVFLKVRRPSKGGSQYADEDRGGGVTGIVEEDYLRFRINLSDYLDSGLFLDHRLTRELVFEYADKARFLNLFAYTGTATVHAAAGGAYSTTTVDLSQTYLNWARDNMELNGFSGDEHEYVRADCLEWVSTMRHSKYRWDLIFVDPPTFSNSSSMGKRTWDVQRDHVEFLIDVSRLLTREGRVIFSCNLKNFKPDVEKLAAAGVEIRDITADTIPYDFERTPKVHHCYVLGRTGN